jgi:hypothetical protein
MTPPDGHATAPPALCRGKSCCWQPSRFRSGTHRSARHAGASAAAVCDLETVPSGGYAAWRWRWRAACHPSAGTPSARRRTSAIRCPGLIFAHKSALDSRAHRDGPEMLTSRDTPSLQFLRHAGEGRHPWRKWVPTSAGMTRERGVLTSRALRGAVSEAVVCAEGRASCSRGRSAALAGLRRRTGQS